MNNNSVTVVIPSSRNPSSDAIVFWKKLSTFDCVHKIKFIVNGPNRTEIADSLLTNFKRLQNVEIQSSTIASATHARNVGLKDTKTPYIHFLDDDDEVLPEFYQKTVSAIKAKNIIGVAVSSFVRIDNSRKTDYKITKANRTVSLESLLVDNNVGVTSGVLLKTKSVLEVGGFDELMPARQDYNLWLRLSKFGNFKILSEPLLIWTEHRSGSSIRRSTSISNHFIAIEKLVVLKEELGWSKLSKIKRRLVISNHYKYLANMSHLHCGKTPWKYISSSLYYYPQVKPMLFLVPNFVTKLARKTLTTIREKKHHGSNYGAIERNIAVNLSNFPKLKRLLKYIYQGAFYLRYSFGVSKVQLHDAVLSKIIIPNFENTESFFGYYDRVPENNKGQLLVHTVGQESCHLHVLNRDATLLKSIPVKAWNYQQGALPFWADDSTVLYNQSVDGVLKTGVLDLRGGTIRYFNGSFQAFSQQSKRIASININLINKMRPEYGFYGKDQIFEFDNQLLAFRSFKQNGEDISFVTISMMERITGVSLPSGKTKVNHVVFSPSGNKACFLLRYFIGAVKHTKLILHDFQRDDYAVIPTGSLVSHYCWLNDDELIFWGENVDKTRGYFLVLSSGTTISIPSFINALSTGDGHPTPMQEPDHVISDTYPDKQRLSHLYKLSKKTGKETKIASFFQPFRFRGDKRIDLHPRYSSVSDSVYVDSGHSGTRHAYKLELQG